MHCRRTRIRESHCHRQISIASPRRSATHRRDRLHRSLPPSWLPRLLQTLNSSPGRNLALHPPPKRSLKSCRGAKCYYFVVTGVAVLRITAQEVERRADDITECARVCNDIQTEMAPNLWEVPSRLGFMDLSPVTRRLTQPGYMTVYPL